MRSRCSNVPAVTLLAVPMAVPAASEEPRLPGIGVAMQEMVAAREIAGAVTVVADHGGIAHLESTGLADIASGRPMTPDTLVWIASMTKPVTSAAVAMLIDEGKVAIALAPISRPGCRMSSVATMWVCVGSRRLRRSHWAIAREMGTPRALGLA